MLKLDQNTKALKFMKSTNISANIAIAFVVALFAGILLASDKTHLKSDTDGKSFKESSELLVDGAATTFDTPSPKKINIFPSHPRIMFRSSDIQPIREKLKDPLYIRLDETIKKDRTKFTGPCSQALVFALYKDREAFAFAKEKLLAGEVHRWGWPYYENQWVFAWACVYDWIADGLTATEKAQAWKAFRSKIGGKFNFDAFENKGQFRANFETNHNDHWGKEVTPYEGIVALAIHGDGVADGWANWTIEKIREQHRSFCSPWGKHGMIDWTNLMAMDTGGSQAATGPTNVTGYVGFYIGPNMLAAGAWSSATDQNLWPKMNFFRYWPIWNTYANATPLSKDDFGLDTMEVVSGKYKTYDSDMAGLANWYQRQYGTSDKKSTLIPRVIWGDSRVTPKSPSDLDLPLAKFLRGADICVSRNNWEKQGTIVAMRSRYIDTLRYEGESGCLWVYQGHSPILVRPRTGKWRDQATSCSGLGFRNAQISRNRLGTKQGAGETYWGAGPKRVGNAYDAANNPGYFSDCLSKEVIRKDFVQFTTNVGKLYIFEGVDFAQRTLVHFPEKELIVTIDQFEIDPNVEYYSTLRLVDAPIIQGNQITWDKAAATVLAFNSQQPIWIGGKDKELLTPWGQWVTAKKYGRGYSKDAKKRKLFGSGSVWTYGKGSNTIVAAIRLHSKIAPKITRDDSGVMIDGTRIQINHKEVTVKSD